MKVCAIIVGCDYWDAFTRRFASDMIKYNPDVDVVVIDNASQPKYIDDGIRILRLEKRVGYGEALNHGLRYASAKRYDWYICFNGDCDMQKEGRIMPIMELLNENTLYGSGWNVDGRLRIKWQYSAWLCISRKIFEQVGYFDENLAAAFEDFDYEKRAMELDFALDTANLPVIHLNKHTRMNDIKSYAPRWEAARLYFQQKHGLEMERWFQNVLGH